MIITKPGTPGCNCPRDVFLEGCNNKYRGWNAFEESINKKHEKHYVEVFRELFPFFFEQKITGTHRGPQLLGCLSWWRVASLDVTAGLSCVVVTWNRWAFVVPNVGSVSLFVTNKCSPHFQNANDPIGLDIWLVRLRLTTGHWQPEQGSRNWADMTSKQNQNG